MKKRAFLGIVCALFFLLSIAPAHAENPEPIGSGMTAVKENGVIKIVSVDPNSEGEKAGIKPGDTLVSMNNETVAGSNPHITWTLRHSENSKPYIVELNVSTRPLQSQASINSNGAPPLQKYEFNGAVHEAEPSIIALSIKEYVNSPIFEDTSIPAPGPGKITITFARPRLASDLRFALDGPVTAWSRAQPVTAVEQTAPDKITVSLGPLQVGTYLLQYCFATEWQGHCPTNVTVMRAIDFKVGLSKTNISDNENFALPGPGQITLNSDRPIDPAKFAALLQGPFEAEWPWPRRKLDVAPGATATEAIGKIGDLPQGNYLLSTCTLTKLDRCDQDEKLVHFTVGDVSHDNPEAKLHSIAQTVVGGLELPASDPAIIDVTFNKRVSDFDIQATLLGPYDNWNGMNVESHALSTVTSEDGKHVRITAKDLKTGLYRVQLEVNYSPISRLWGLSYPIPDYGAVNDRTMLSFSVGEPYDPSPFGREQR